MKREQMPLYALALALVVGLAASVNSQRRGLR
jgi:hypothetical protein